MKHNFLKSFFREDSQAFLFVFFFCHRVESGQVLLYSFRFVWHNLHSPFSPTFENLCLFINFKLNTFTTFVTLALTQSLLIVLVIVSFSFKMGLNRSIFTQTFLPNVVTNYQILSVTFIEYGQSVNKQVFSQMKLLREKWMRLMLTKDNDM